MSEQQTAQTGGTKLCHSAQYLINLQPLGDRASMVDGAAGQEELPNSTPNGTSQPASVAEASAEDREKASEWRLKGNEDFKSEICSPLHHDPSGMLPAACAYSQCAKSLPLWRRSSNM